MRRVALALLTAFVATLADRPALAQGQPSLAYRFLTPDRVELSVIADAQVIAEGLVLVWERVK
jgi:hypothetical protein